MDTNRFTIVAGLLAALGCAGAASAQFSYQNVARPDFTFADNTLIFYSPTAGTVSIRDNYALPGVDLPDGVNLTTTTHTLSLNDVRSQVPAGQYEALQSLQVTATNTLITQSNYMHFGFEYQISGDINGQLGAGEEFAISSRTDNGGLLVVDQDSRVRFTLSIAGSSLLDRDLANALPFIYTAGQIQVSTSGASVVPFVAGWGENSSTAGGSNTTIDWNTIAGGALSFEVDLPAGTTIGFGTDNVVNAGITVNNRARFVNNSGPLTDEDLNRFLSASLTIEVIPAPSAAALLGMGGLIAARRRRAC